jgi:GT2 family glycosyltransferase
VSVSLKQPLTPPAELAQCLEGRAPIAVRALDIDSGVDVLRLPASRSGAPYSRLLVFLRRGEDPLGWISLPAPPDGEVSLDGLGDMLGTLAELGSTGAGGGLGGEATGSWGRLSGRPPEAPRGATGGGIVGHDHSAPEPAAQPLLSIVVATCANAELVVRCVEEIQAHATDPYEVIVVENRPARSSVARAIEERFGGGQRIRYVEERRPGLACARNAGLRTARGELVAFTDDDVLVDGAWVPAIRRAFAATPEVGCVTGLILPLELETPAQLLIERFASYGKGFLPRIYSLEKPPPDQPLFPYTAGYFGSGANMAFRTGTLRDLGGFDPVLGTGTRARGGEDLDVCIRVLNAGARLAYEPRAIVWHRHPETDAHLRRRAFDYGTALGAMLTKQILTGPNRRGIFSRVPQGARYYTDPESRKNAARGPVFPQSLTHLERVGLLYGPIAYCASRFGARR